MSNFGVSILENSHYHVDADGDNIIIIDHSNYDTSTEEGHEQLDFEWKKIIITNPDNTEYVYSTAGDGDEMLAIPATSVLPIETVYSYTTGDGIYNMKLYTVPTWRNDANYTVIGNHHVRHGGIIYKCIAANVGQNPVGGAAWQAIGSIEDLPNKYRLDYTFAVYCDAVACYMQKVYDAFCAVNNNYCHEDLCKNEFFMGALKLKVLIDSIKAMSDNNNWTSAAHAINLTKQICCCG